MSSATPRTWSIALVAVFTACFSEQDAPVVDCPLGTVGCHCQSADVCQSSDLVCRDAYCIPSNCVPGEKYCQCDAGTCDGSLMCQDGAVCLPPASGSDTTDAPSTTTGTNTAGTTSPATADSSTTSDDSTGTPLPWCDATPGALFCGDFDDGTYDAGWSEPVQRGGATVQVVEDAMGSPPSPPYALRIDVPVNTVETGGLLAATFDAPLPFAGSARAAVRFEPGCFDKAGASERRVLALSFYAPGGGFVTGVRIDATAQGGHLYQWGPSDAVTNAVPLPEFEASDSWIVFEIGIDAASGNASVRVDGDEWTGELTPMPTDIVPFVTVGPISDSNDRGCTIWFDDVAVLSGTD